MKKKTKVIETKNVEMGINQNATFSDLKVKKVNSKDIQFRSAYYIQSDVFHRNINGNKDEKITNSSLVKKEFKS